jgi:hypothetical protein
MLAGGVIISTELLRHCRHGSAYRDCALVGNWCLPQSCGVRLKFRRTSSHGDNIRRISVTYLEEKIAQDGG